MSLCCTNKHFSKECCGLRSSTPKWAGVWQLVTFDSWCKRPESIVNSCSQWGLDIISDLRSVVAIVSRVTLDTGCAPYINCRANNSEAAQPGHCVTNQISRKSCLPLKKGMRTAGTVCVRMLCIAISASSSAKLPPHTHAASTVCHACCISGSITLTQSFDIQHLSW